MSTCVPSALLLPSAYFEHAPPPALRGVVECFWTRGAPTPGEKPHQVLLDGAIDIVLGFGHDGASPTSKLVVGDDDAAPCGESIPRASP
jgi:hypothetical protein